jgi:hypothetical protein
LTFLLPFGIIFVSAENNKHCILNINVCAYKYQKMEVYKMGQIRLDPDEVIQKAQVYRNSSEEIDQILQRIQSTHEQLMAVWEGQGAQASN